jgi:hypothetical protein
MAGRHVLVTLIPRERTMLREALAEYRSRYEFSQTERDTYDDLMRRIPDPAED